MIAVDLTHTLFCLYVYTSGSMVYYQGFLQLRSYIVYISVEFILSRTSFSEYDSDHNSHLHCHNNQKFINMHTYNNYYYT